MMTSERHLQLAPAPINVVEANGRTYINSGGTSFEVPQADIPRITAALLVSMERVADAASDSAVLS